MSPLQAGRTGDNISNDPINGSVLKRYLATPPDPSLPQARPQDSPPSDLPFKALLAPFLLGGMCSSLLFGIMIVQVGLYFVRFWKVDSKYYKATVSLLALISAASWASLLQVEWQIFITGHNNDRFVALAPITTIIPVTLVMASAVLSQCFFATRCYKLCSGNRTFATILLSLIICSTAPVIATLCLIDYSRPLAFNTFVLRLAPPGGKQIAVFWRITRLLEAYLIASAAVDITLTTVLVIKLVRDRRRLGNSKHQKRPNHDSVISRLLFLSLTTGSISTLAAIADVILIFTTIEKSNTAMALCLQLSHIYALVVCSSLNLRTELNPKRKRGIPNAGAGTSMTVRNSGLGSGSEIEADGHGCDWGRTMEIQREREKEWTVKLEEMHREVQSQLGGLQEANLPPSSWEKKKKGIDRLEKQGDSAPGEDSGASCSSSSTHHERKGTGSQWSLESALAAMPKVQHNDSKTLPPDLGFVEGKTSPISKTSQLPPIAAISRPSNSVTTPTSSLAPISISPSVLPHSHTKPHLYPNPDQRPRGKSFPPVQSRLGFSFPSKNFPTLEPPLTPLPPTPSSSPKAPNRLLLQTAIPSHSANDNLTSAPPKVAFRARSGNGFDRSLGLDYGPRARSVEGGRRTTSGVNPELTAASRLPSSATKWDDNRVELEEEEEEEEENDDNHRLRDSLFAHLPAHPFSSIATASYSLPFASISRSNFQSADVEVKQPTPRSSHFGSSGVRCNGSNRIRAQTLPMETRLNPTPHQTKR